MRGKKKKNTLLVRSVSRFVLGFFFPGRAGPSATREIQSFTGTQQGRGVVAPAR